MKKYKGFTLMELLIAIALLSIIGVVVVNLLGIPIKAFHSSEKEFDVQSEIRATSAMVNNSVRDATAAFLLTKHDEAFTDKWNYLISEKKDGKTRIVLQRWDKDKHVPFVLAEADETEMDYSIEFHTSEKGQLLDYKIIAKDKKTGLINDISTQLKPLNSFNIIDNSKVDYTLSPPVKRGNCLAFRTDKPDIKSGTSTGFHHVSVSLVLDLSSSMIYGMDGEPVEVGHEHDRRIDIMRKEVKALLQQFADSPASDIVDISFHPYSYFAYCYNDRDDIINQKFWNIHKWGKLDREKFVDELDTVYYTAKKKGATDDKEYYYHHAASTNTGDGMRRGFYAMKKYNDEKLKGDSTKRIKNFILILTDGEPKAASYAIPSSGITNPPESELKKLYYGDGSILSDPNKKRLTKEDKHYIQRSVKDFTIKFARMKQNNGKFYSEEVGRRLIAKYRAKNLSDTEGKVDVTVIGFSARPQDLVQIDALGRACEAKLYDGKPYLTAGSPEQLKAVIQKFVQNVVDAASYWYVAGPQ